MLFIKVSCAPEMIRLCMFIAVEVSVGQLNSTQPEKLWKGSNINTPRHTTPFLTNATPLSPPEHHDRNFGVYDLQLIGLVYEGFYLFILMIFISFSLSPGVLSGFQTLLHHFCEKRNRKF
ncbi:hypothetical protein CDAR_259941 [Caerostris darwini]|uniref:Uncharacterized protein n=1 Tax=Caerostris darwini TaxID=1538125 RepID=A0AAV4Q828_9ARAC|nr:hypothetical protein CDAR_259941 [Caerostris darwini]